MNGRRHHGSGTLPALLMILLLASHGARGQEVYNLGEADTWERVAEPAPGTPEAALAEARRALAEGEYALAADLATAWIRAHPDHPLQAEAFLIRGDSRVARKNYYKALFDYEFIARRHLASDAFVRALERELAIAKLFARGVKRKLWGIRWIDATEEAEELLIRIQERLPGSALAAEAGMELGDFYFRRGDHELAAEMFDIFLENYPRSPLVEKARQRLIASYLALARGPAFSAVGLYEARAELQRLLATSPAAAADLQAVAMIRGIDEKAAAKMLATAEWYLDTGDPIGAEFTIRRLVRRYPRTYAASEAVELIPAILPHLPPAIREGMPDYEALLESPAPPQATPPGEPAILAPKEAVEEAATDADEAPEDEEPNAEGVLPPDDAAGPTGGPGGGR